jgi:hypothetical protein
LWTHLVAFVFDTWAAETWGDGATATATAASIDVAREAWEANGALLSNAVGQTCTLEALALLVKDRPHLWASSSPSTDTAAQPPHPPPPQPDDPPSLSMETSPGWLQPTYWRQTIQDHVLPSFLTEAVWRPLLVYEAKR